MPAEAAAPSIPVSAKKKRVRRSVVDATYSLVYVEWEDHNTHGDWVTDADLDGEPVVVKTVGWLVKENDKTITVTSSFAKDSSHPYSNVTTILKQAMTKRHVIQPRQDA